MSLHLGPGARVAVFRALMLGDLLCAVPALRALRAGLPQARITLVGLPWAQELASRLDLLDDFIAFPGHPLLPERRATPEALQAFLAHMRAERWDLAVQLHGSGWLSNGVVAGFGARRMAGFHEAGAEHGLGALGCPWPAEGHEIERLLALTDRLGLPRQGLQLEFPVRDEDRRALRQLWPAAGTRPHVCMHPGAQLASRRWPVERFAAIADRLLDAGWQPVVTGTEAERPLAAALLGAMRRPGAVDLVGRTSLWTLGALVEGARLVLANDTGISHVAAALGTPSVIVSSGGDARRWRPLDERRHEVLWQPMPCRPCGFRDCPYDHGCATAIGVERVWRAAEWALLSADPVVPPHRPPARPAPELRA